MLWEHVGFWFFVWTMAAPMTRIAGFAPLVLVAVARTRPIGRIIAGVAVVAGTALTLLFAKAHDIALHSERRAADLSPPEERARTALSDGKISLTGVAFGLAATALAFRPSRRRPLPPA